MVGLTRERLRALYSDGPSFPYYLPWHSVDPEGHGVALVDGSLGLVWEVTPAASDTLSEEALSALSDGIEGLFARLPDGAVVQFVATSDQELGEALARYEAHTKCREGMGALVLESKLAKVGQREPHFTHQGLPFRSRRIRTLMTLRLCPDWGRPGLGDRIAYTLGRGNVIARRFRAGYVRARRRILQVGVQVEELLGQLGIGCRRLDADAVVDVLYRALNPARARRLAAPRYETLTADGASLRANLVYSEPALGASGFSLEGVESRVVTLKSLAPHTTPGCITGEIDFGGAFFSLMDLTSDLTLVYNIEVPPRATVRDFLDARKSHAWRAMGGQLHDVSVENRALKEEVDEAILATKVQNQRLLFARLHLVVSGREPDELDSRSDRVLGALGRLGFEGMVEDAYGASLWLSTLPLAFDPANDRSLKRARRVLSPNLADMLPLYGTWRGTPTPDLLFLNRRGEPATFSFFDSDSAPHGILAGRTGAGKSFWVNQMLLSVMRLGSHVFIFDKGNSYRRLCGLLGGQYVVASPDHPRTINPFAGRFSRERLRFLVSLLAEMAQGTRPDEVITKREKAQLARAITAAYRAKERWVRYRPSAGPPVGAVECRRRVRLELPLGRTDWPAAKGLSRVAALRLPGRWTEQLSGGTDAVDAIHAWVESTVEAIRRVGLVPDHRHDPYRFEGEGAPEDPLREVYVPGTIRVLYEREEDLGRLAGQGLAADPVEGERVLEVGTDDELGALLASEPRLVGEANDEALALVAEEVTLRDVVRVLGEESDLAARMSAFWGEGPYAGFFDGPNEVDFSHPLTVFEMAEIGSDRDLATVMLLVLMHRITDFVQDEALRGKQKYLLLDEAWTFLKSENTAGFLENAYRTFRKFGTCVLMITQQASDFTATPAGVAIRANAPNRVLLEQAPDVVGLMARDLDLDEKHTRVLKGVRTVKGKYSEALVISSGGSGVLRVVPDPVSYWLSTTDAADVAYLNRLQHERGELLSALREAAGRYPGGLRGEEVKV
ncbi:MAG: TraC family protein [Planctomycetes bacterium]|nr:TraC family protein [Planctomycetota bacterium]